MRITRWSRWRGVAHLVSQLIVEHGHHTTYAARSTQVHQPARHQSTQQHHPYPSQPTRSRYTQSEASVPPDADDSGGVGTQVAIVFERVAQTHHPSSSFARRLPLRCFVIQSYLFRLGSKPTYPSVSFLHLFQHQPFFLFALRWTQQQSRSARLYGPTHQQTVRQGQHGPSLRLLSLSRRVVCPRYTYLSPLPSTNTERRYAGRQDSSSGHGHHHRHSRLAEDIVLGFDAQGGG